jgi:hypothetical protein
MMTKALESIHTHSHDKPGLACGFGSRAFPFSSLHMRDMERLCYISGTVGPLNFRLRLFVKAGLANSFRVCGIWKAPLLIECLPNRLKCTLP